MVGGGLLGSAVAYELACLGASVTLVDRRDAGQATAAGAGILSPETGAWGSAARHRFALRAGAHYPSLVERIEEDGGGTTGYGPVSVTTVTKAGDDPVAGERLAAILRQADDQGHDDSAGGGVRRISPEEAVRRFPPLEEVEEAVFHEGGARVDGGLLAGAIQRAAVARGVRVARGTVDGLRTAGDTALGVWLQGQPLDADAVVLAAGAWLSAFEQQLGLGALVHPMRGQIVHLQWPDGPTAGWSVVSHGGYYLLPWPDGRVVLGASREASSGLVPHLTAGGTHEVLHAGLRLAPGLAHAAIREWRVGLRPASVDGLPILGPVPGLSGCYLATGHGAGGLLLGPYSAHVLAGVICGAEPRSALEPFDVARFAGGAVTAPGSDPASTPDSPGSRR